MKRTRIGAAVVVLVCSSTWFAVRADEPMPKWDPLEAYQTEQIEGWTIRVNKQLQAPDQAELRQQTLRLLGDHLYRITRVVPGKALAQLRKIPIWVELAHPRHPCMCYHVSPDWLRDHDMNPEKAGGVEIANAKNFLRWTHQQPWMVLHELAHGFHHQVLTYEHPEVKACYEQARDAKIYESVLHINGRKQRHYALTNDKEYFAELSESYFGTNDFYPFVRAELKEVDPRGFALMEKLWGGRKETAID
jgi:hypothetical protein